MELKIEQWEKYMGTFLDSTPEWDNHSQHIYLTIYIGWAIYIGKAKVDNIFPISKGKDKIDYTGVGKLVKVSHIKYWWYTKVKGMHPSAIYYKLGEVVD